MKNSINISGDNVQSYAAIAIRAARMWEKRGYKVSDIAISDSNNSLTFALLDARGGVESIISLEGKRLKFAW